MPGVRLTINPANNILFLGYFPDTFDITIHDNRRSSKYAVPGNFHGIRYFFDPGIHARFRHGLFDDFFGLLALGTTGSQNFDFHDNFLSDDNILIETLFAGSGECLLQPLLQFWFRRD